MIEQCPDLYTIRFRHFGFCVAWITGGWDHGALGRSKGASIGFVLQQETSNSLHTKRLELNPKP